MSSESWAEQIPAWKRSKGRKCLLASRLIKQIGLLIKSRSLARIRNALERVKISKTTTTLYGFMSGDMVRPVPGDTGPSTGST